MTIKKFLATLVFLVVIIVSQSSFVSAKEKINKFYVDIEINPDSSINVKESIEYDFSIQNKHGIYRDIPIKYKTDLGLNRNIRISDISVTDELGNKYNFTKEKKGRYLKIKIGDADKLITGVHTYEISYRVSSAFNFFDTHDELYWNATGNEWKVPINNVKVMLHSKNIQKIECFKGTFGSKETCDKKFFNNSYAEFADTDFLGGEGMTFVIGLKKGTVRELTSLEKVILFLKDNLLTILLPVVVVIGLFLHWFIYGRDYKSKGPIIPRWEAPDNLAPAEAGIIIDEKFDPQDLSAMIIDLAVRGYISIKQVRHEVLFFKLSDYELTLLKDNSNIYSDDLLKQYEQDFLVAFFGSQKKVLVSSKNGNFSREYKKLTSQVYKKVTGNYFVKNPEKVVSKYTIFGVIFIIFLTIVIFFSKMTNDFVLLGWNMGGWLVVIFLIIGYGKLMIKKTHRGVRVKNQIEGLKMYLKTAEKKQLEFLNAPEKNAKHFEEMLPYAVALGVTKEWSEQFNDLIQNEPKWFNNGMNNFNATSFNSAIQNFSSATSIITGSTTNASSGGSGFSGGSSGGGFGGGGGGSW